MIAFRHLPVGVFGHDDGAVDKRKPTARIKENSTTMFMVRPSMSSARMAARKTWNGDADQARGPKPQGGDDHDHDEDGGRTSTLFRRSASPVSIRFDRSWK